MSKPYRVCKVEELPTGQRKIIEIDKKSIGVFNIEGEFYALRNMCPHQLAPLCEGKITGVSEPSEVGEYQWCRSGEIIRCPWHKWEFDIKTGKSIFNPHKVRVKSYEVTVEASSESSLSCDQKNGVCELEEDPSVETYEVTVESGDVMVHV